MSKLLFLIAALLCSCHYEPRITAQGHEHTRYQHEASHILEILASNGDTIGVATTAAIYADHPEGWYLQANADRDTVLQWRACTTPPNYFERDTAPRVIYPAINQTLCVDPPAPPVREIERPPHDISTVVRRKR